MSYRVLYHVTPDTNLQGILASGINPQKSLGKRKTSYLVTKSMIAWALAHVAMRKRVPVCRLLVLEVWVYPWELLHTHQKGVYVITEPHMATVVHLPEEFVSDENDVWEYEGAALELPKEPKER